MTVPISPVEQLRSLWNQDKQFREEVGRVLEQARKARYPTHTADAFGRLLTKHRPNGRTGSGIRSLEKGFHQVSTVYMEELLEALNLRPEALIRCYRRPATQITEMVPGVPPTLATEPASLPLAPEPTEVLILARMIAAFLALPEDTQLSVMRMVEEDAAKYR